MVCGSCVNGVCSGGCRGRYEVGTSSPYDAGNVNSVKYEGRL